MPMFMPMVMPVAQQNISEETNKVTKIETGNQVKESQRNPQSVALVLLSPVCFILCCFHMSLFWSLGMWKRIVE